MAASPRLIHGFREIAPAYDLLFCDIWGVIHKATQGLTYTDPTFDFEANPQGPSMTLEEARAFVTHIHDMTGRRAMRPRQVQRLGRVASPAVARRPVVRAGVSLA